MKSARAPATLAVVDMGSNSFRLEVGRVEGDQIYRLDTQREMLRIGAGLDDRGNLTPEARRLALACLARFAERLAGFPSSAVRAVATNAFRVAGNARSFLARAERTLGFAVRAASATTRSRSAPVATLPMLLAASSRASAGAKSSWRVSHESSRVRALDR